MVAILGYIQLRIVWQRHIRTVVIEGLGLAMRKGKIRIFVYCNLLLPLPNESGVYLPLFGQG